MSKPLNVSKEEAIRILVDYEINKYVAYLELDSGSVVPFLNSSNWRGIIDNSEYSKYVNEWKVKVECSKRCLSKRTNEY